MRTTTKSFAVAAVASLSLFTAACGSDDSTDAPADDNTSAAPDDAADPAADLVGAGCADYAAAVPDGAGSVSGMSQDPVATAASNNPLLKTLTAAVSGGLNPDVDLVDTLNGGEFTVFAPVDDAFAALPEETVKTLGTPEGADTLSSVLTYHVIPGQISPCGHRRHLQDRQRRRPQGLRLRRLDHRRRQQRQRHLWWRQDRQRHGVPDRRGAHASCVIRAKGPVVSSGAAGPFTCR